MSVRIIQKGITAHLNQLAVMAGYPARITGLVIARDTSAVEKWFHGKTIPRNRSAAQNASRTISVGRRDAGPGGVSGAQPYRGAF